jgi:hypothetical protein
MLRERMICPLLVRHRSRYLNQIDLLKALRTAQPPAGEHRQDGDKDLLQIQQKKYAGFEMIHLNILMSPMPLGPQQILLVQQDPRHLLVGSVDILLLG